MSPLLNIIAATTANHSVAAVHLEFKAFGEFVDLIEGIGGVLVGDGSYVGNGDAISDSFDADGGW